MKNYLSIALVTIFFSHSVLATELKTEQDELSYSLGVIVGARFLKGHEDIDFEKLVAGMKTAYEGKKTLLAEAEAATLVRKASKAVYEKAQQEAKEQGTAFLAENAKKKGVTTTASGLQYEVIEKGSGESPKSTDTVTVHYRGTLINGEEFDSSYQRNSPATFALNQVIGGWTEGLQLMKPGAKYKFYIPSDLAYGERGTRGKIGPNETLIFDVELLEVAKAEQPQKTN